MTPHPIITARRGSYVGTTDDRADRWYLAVKGQPFRPYGFGYRTRREALEAAREILERNAQ